MLRILDFIENTLKVHWQDHEGFVALQERVLALRMILEEAGDKPLEGMNRTCLMNLRTNCKLEICLFYQFKLPIIRSVNAHGYLLW